MAPQIEEIEPPLPQNWAKIFTDKGEPYYWNSVTEETSWDAPNPDSDTDVSTDTEAGAEWSERTDDKNNTYYWNKDTGETSWTLPPGIVMKKTRV